MPTVFRSGEYRFFFFSNEGNEPIHIHVESGSGYAKFWIDPEVLVESSGFRSHELSVLRRIIEDRSEEIRSKWNEHFGNS